MIFDRPPIAGKYDSIYSKKRKPKDARKKAG